MSDVKLLKNILGGILLSFLTIFCSGSYAESQTMYTAQNIWYKTPKKVFVINYQIGKILPVGTRVKNIRVKKGKRASIQFVTIDDNLKFTIYLTQKYYKNTPFDEFKSRLFTTKDFSQLTAGLNSTEIQGIRSGKIFNNMSKRAVLIAYGYPPEHKTPSLENNKWYYWKSRFRNEAVYFDHRNLVQIKTKTQVKRKKATIVVNKDQRTIPEIVITQPSVTRGLMISKKKIIVAGKATDPDGIYEVMINGNEAALSSDGSFKAEVLLSVGTNNINVIVTDTQNTVAQKKITLHRKAQDITLHSKSEKKKLPSLTRGIYYALIIAVQDYAHSSINDLDQPVNDAKALKKVLLDKYTFNRNNVILLENPDRETIITNFEMLSNQVGPDDSCLIFYAGHGYWDKQFKQGYWFPSNASRNNRSNWISNSTIVDFIRGIKSNHTLLVADSCFSGGIFKTRKAFGDASPAIKELYKLPSRKALTSGTLNEVPDKSVFVEYLVKRLDTNKKTYISSEQLFINFRMAVINNSPINQVPQFGEIRQAGDEGGDFIFTHK